MIIKNRKKISALAVSFFCLFFLTGVGCINFSSQSQGVMGMYRSENKGEAWAQITSMPTLEGVKNLSGLSVYNMFFDPSDDDAIYLATRGQGLYYSYNKGDSWQSSPHMNNKYIYSVVVDPADKCTIYATDGPHIFKTNDCLRSWSLVFTEERLNERLVDLAVDPDNSDIVYGAQLNGDVLRSEDAGKSWRIIKRFGFGIRDLVIDKVDSNTKRIYVAAYKDGLYRSDDSGIEWINLSVGFDGFNDSKQFNRIVMNNNKKDSLFWISKYGILRSDDAGKTWKSISLLTPPGSVDIYGFAVSPKNDKEIYYTGTVLDNKKKNLKSTFYISSDGGNNWVTRQLPTNTVPVSLYIYKKNTSMLFLGFTLFDSTASVQTKQFGI
ncbi:MAG: hypothetical protein ABH832_00190 [bacterium]